MKKALIVVALIGVYLPALADQAITIPSDPDHEQRIDQLRSDVESLKLRVDSLEAAPDEPDTGEGDTTGDTGGTDPTVPSGSTVEPLAACDPDVVWDGTTSLNKIAGDLGNGTIGVPEGTVRVVKLSDGTTNGFLSARGNIRVCGMGDTPSVIEVVGGGVAWKSRQGFLTVDNIVTRGLRVSTTKNTAGVRLDRMKMSLAGGTCFKTSYGPQLDANFRPGGFGDDPLEVKRFVFTDVEFDRCTAPGYFTHSVYISTRGCTFRADNVRFASPDGLEGFRSLCRFSMVTNSHLQNWAENEDGTIATRKNGSTYGATPLDAPACSAYILRGNTFDVRNGGGTVAAIGLRARLSMSTCDVPNNYDLAALTDHVPWEDVAPVVGNPHIFPIVIEGNTFVLRGEAGNARVISAWGTYPRRHTDPVTSSSNNDYLAVPDQWKERAAVFWKNNTLVGDWPTIHRLDLRQRRADTSDPAAWQPGEIPPVPFIETTEELPQTCDDLAYLQWWDEPGDHTGFPACP